MKLPSRHRRAHPETMTAKEELFCLLAWAEQQRLTNIAAALRRVLGKLKNAQAPDSTN
jgi:hypothetical protein